MMPGVGYFSFFRLMYKKVVMKGFNKELFLEILERYNSGKATREEVQYLEAYYNLFEINDDFLNDDNEKSIKETIKLSVDHAINVYEGIAKGAGTNAGIFKMSFLRYAAAAMALIMLSIGTYFILRNGNDTSQQLAVHHELSPGTNKAILTLANGKKIVLDKSANGEIAKQPGISIANTPDGQIVYTVIPTNDNPANGMDISSNTISTPKGGQYQVVLSDGTRVWLNSASSISYPTIFSKEERLVELNGEAYFEVAKNKKVPFRVKNRTQIIEVLGTHFNVNSYTDEPVMRTTLLEGSVKISTGNDQAILVPGQQARVNKSGTDVSVESNINTDKVVAWKNGVFSFENDDLKSVMRQITRWYDVNVVYSGPLPNEKFFGEISRNSNLSEVFKILELNNVHFDVVGKTIKVSVNPSGTVK